MRIIAGKYRGRKLRGPHGIGLRPTSDRLKETLFDILGARVQDAVFIDAFAGTGSIGLEALSRGAREVLFIESETAGVRLIRQNLDLCRLENGYMVLQREIFSALRQLAQRGYCCDIFFLDPPYAWDEYAGLLDEIFRSGSVLPNSIVIVEHHRKAQLPVDEPSFRRTRLVRQGDGCLSFYAST